MLQNFGVSLGAYVTRYTQGQILVTQLGWSVDTTGLYHSSCTFSITATTNFYHGLVYSQGGDGNLVGYSDSSYMMDCDDGKGTTGMTFYLSVNLVTWSSQKQRNVALSSCESEFMATTSMACQALWLRNLLKELTSWEVRKVKLYVDNKFAVELMKNLVFHGRSKHIETRYHFIRECVENGLICMEHISGEDQRADTLTKALLQVKFVEMKSLLRVEKLEDPIQI